MKTSENICGNVLFLLTKNTVLKFFSWKIFATFHKHPRATASLKHPKGLLLRLSGRFVLTDFFSTDWPFRSKTAVINVFRNSR